MQHVSQLTTLPQPASSEQTSAENENGKSASTGPQSALTEKHIDLLWLRMAKIYGHKWTSSYGESDDGTWLAGLYDVTADQVRYGLEQLRTDGERIWPPTLPEFRALCLPEKAPYYHKDYVALPRPTQDPNAIENALTKMREALKIDPEKYAMTSGTELTAFVKPTALQ